MAIDPESLQIVLDNLIENVRQHAGSSSKARLSWSLDKGLVLIRLDDDGLGISPGNARRIFDRFLTTARDRGGTGLGLSIARSQLGAFGGSIALQPSERGAVFEIALPLARDMHSAPAWRPPGSPPLTRGAPRADNSPASLRMLR